MGREVVTIRSEAEPTSRLQSMAGRRLAALGDVMETWELIILAVAIVCALAALYGRFIHD